jgi:hypothetical protein
MPPGVATGVVEDSAAEVHSVDAAHTTPTSVADSVAAVVLELVDVAVFFV